MGIVPAKLQFRPLYIFLVVISITTLIVLAGMYGMSRWYKSSQAHKPEVIGASFNPAYAESLGLDAQQTMDALIDEVGVRHFRLVSYWSQLEPAPGKYDFRLLDWQFAKAEDAGATVTLAIGLRQPRWPECHMPGWAKDMPKSEWQQRLEKYIQRVVERYRNAPVLISYQLENEYYIDDFGTCQDADRARLVREFDLIKRLDSKHPIIMSRSNNLAGWPAGKPEADIYATSIYRRVWNTRLMRTYFDYPVPAWYYGFIAGWQKLATGRDMMIHELQAEPWPPDRQSIKDTSLAEQNKSFTATMLPERVAFARQTGIREYYLWGSEYWYYRKVKLHDPSVWDAAKSEFRL